MIAKRALPLLIALPALAGCASDLDRFLKPPSETPPPSFEQATPSAAATNPDPFWWRALNDPLLDSLVEHALTTNRDIRAAQGEIRRARAVSRLQGWTLLPTGAGNATFERQRQASSTFIQPGGPPGGFGPNDDEEFFSVGLQASWEPDVFGRLRPEVTASRAEAQAAIAAFRGAKVVIAAEVAAQYVGVRGLQARVAAARANAAAQTRTLELTINLKEAGRGTRLDVARAREQLAATEAQLATLEGELASALYALSVVLGPGGATLTDQVAAGGPIPQPPESFGVGSPEALLRRRPDIVEQERRLVAAALRAASRADFFPRITLVGGASLQAFSVEALSSQAAFGYFVGPRIDWPLLDFRRNQLRLQAREAGAEIEFQRFDATVADAIADVEIALVSYVSARRAADFSREGAAAAREAAELAELRYREGIDPFLQVLDAQRRQAEAEDRLAQAEGQAATAYVRLGQALGAGWDAGPAPAEAGIQPVRAAAPGFGPIGPEF